MKRLKATVKFKQWVCWVQISHYPSSGQPSIMLYEVETGEPIAVASINIPDCEALGINEVFIKNYSENEGVLNALEAAGILQRKSRVIPVGRTFANIAEFINVD